MDVLGDPLGRQLAPPPFRARLAGKRGAGGGELEAQAVVVEEPGEIGVLVPPRLLAGDDIG